MGHPVFGMSYPCLHWQIRMFEEEFGILEGEAWGWGRFSHGGREGNGARRFIGCENNSVLVITEFHFKK